MPDVLRLYDESWSPRHSELLIIPVSLSSENFVANVSTFFMNESKKKSVFWANCSGPACLHTAQGQGFL